ncbi:MAG: hypothetical protein FJ290_12315 [Planctomycetes bacterium]|nr:hypothetical protein [Planctomycetota bacterium]
MRQACLTALAAALAAPLFLGCDDGGGPDYSSPKATFTTLREAAKAGNDAAMLACFSQECRRKAAEVQKMVAALPKASAQAAKAQQRSIMRELMARARKAKCELGAEQMHGDKATLVVATDGEREVIEFIKEGESWKIHPRQVAEMNVEEVRKSIEEAMKEGSQDAVKKGPELPNTPK